MLSAAVWLVDITGRPGMFDVLLSGIWKEEGWESRQIHRFSPSYRYKEFEKSAKISLCKSVSQSKHLLFVLSQSKAVM